MLLDATRLLALYRRTESDTMYIFDEKLRRLKSFLSLAELTSLETRLPRMRSIRQQERAETAGMFNGLNCPHNSSDQQRCISSSSRASSKPGITRISDSPTIQTPPLRQSKLLVSFKLSPPLTSPQKNSAVKKMWKKTMTITIHRPWLNYHSWISLPLIR